jgi:hypothetical protein
VTRPVSIQFPRSVTEHQLVAFCRGLSGLRAPWWRSLFAGQPVIRFELHASEEGIAHFLWLPARARDYVLGQLRVSIPGARVEPADPGSAMVVDAIELRVTGLDAPLRTDSATESSAAILATLQPLREGETVVIQWLISPDRFRPGFNAFDRLLGREPASGDVLRAQREKRSEPAFAATVRIGASAPTVDRTRHLVRRTLGAFHLGTTERASFRRRLLPGALVGHQLTDGLRPIATWPCLLNAREIAAFLGVPIEGPAVAGLELGAARLLPPPARLARKGRIIGRATFPGATRPVALSVEDSLRHLHVIGPTGVGKSTLMAGLILGDISSGRAVIAIDPKGDLIMEVLERIPAERASDVIVFDPADASRPVGFNLLEGISEAPELITDHVVGIFHRLYSAFWGPRTDDILRAAVLTLAQEPGMTLAEVPVLLTDGGFRRRLLGRLNDHVLESFWGWFESLSDAERAQAVGPVLNKLRAFLLRRRLRTVIGQAESKISLERVITERKILLVSLAKGVLGEDAAGLLGAAVIARLWQTVQARAAIPAKDRHPVFCHIDEFQDYIQLPTPLGDVLAQARGYGLGLTLAHQHLGQLPKDVRDAVINNARSKVVFQTSAADARVLARELGPIVEPDDLQALGAFEAYLAAAGGRSVLPPVSIRTLPLGPGMGRAQAIRAASRQRYGREADAVDAEIRARAERIPERLVVGTRRRS